MIRLPDKLTEMPHTYAEQAGAPCARAGSGWVLCDRRKPSARGQGSCSRQGARRHPREVRGRARPRGARTRGRRLSKRARW